MRTLFLFIVLFAITGCNETENVTMIYQETQCSDAWYDSPGSTIEETIIEYFDNTHNIKLKEVTIKTVNTGATCQACSCSSGREVEVHVNEKNVSVFEDEGFTRK